MANTVHERKRPNLSKRLSKIESEKKIKKKKRRIEFFFPTNGEQMLSSTSLRNLSRHVGFQQSKI